MKVAILQSNYLPWTGVFELINSVDKFVFYDNVQFTKQDWRTRNKIYQNLWLSVPIHRKKLNTNIIDIKICNENNWKKKHYKSFYQYYSKSKYFSQYKHLLEFYLLHWEYLYELNRYITEKISRILGINSNIGLNRRKIPFILIALIIRPDMAFLITRPDMLHNEKL